MQCKCVSFGFSIKDIFALFEWPLISPSVPVMKYCSKHQEYGNSFLKYTWFERLFVFSLFLLSPQKLINISSEVMNIHIIPTQTKHFQTAYTKKVFFFFHCKLLTSASSVFFSSDVSILFTVFLLKYRLIPGLAYTLKVRFCSDECRYFYDCIRVHCKVWICQTSSHKTCGHIHCSK